MTRFRLHYLDKIKKKVSPFEIELLPPRGMLTMTLPLKKKDQRPDAAELQNILVQHGYPGTIDDDFGYKI